MSPAGFGSIIHPIHVKAVSDYYKRDEATESPKFFVRVTAPRFLHNVTVGGRGL